MKDLIEALTIFLKYADEYSPTHCEHDELMVPGIQGFTTRRLFFLLEGKKGEVTVTYDSLKGGRISTTVELR